MGSSIRLVGGKWSERLTACAKSLQEGRLRIAYTLVVKCLSRQIVFFQVLQDPLIFERLLLANLLVDLRTDKVSHKDPYKSGAFFV